MLINPTMVPATHSVPGNELGLRAIDDSDGGSIDASVTSTISPISSVMSAVDTPPEDTTTAGGRSPLGP